MSIAKKPLSPWSNVSHSSPQTRASQPKRNPPRYLPNVSEKDAEQDGDGVGAVGPADVGLALALAHHGQQVVVVVALVLLVHVVDDQDSRDSGDGGQEPESKVALAVGVDVDEGAAVERVVGFMDVAVVEEGLVLGVAGSRGLGGCVCGAVVGHYFVLVDEGRWRSE